MSVRAVARVNLAAIERNCARLARASPRLCAVVKADAYGHGAVECSRAALAGGASWLAVAAAAEAQELRDGGIAARDPRDGRADARRARAGAGRRRRGRRLDRRVSRLAGRARRRHECTSSSTAAWGGSGRATRRSPIALVERVAASAEPRAGRRDDAPRDRRGGRPGVHGRSSSSSSRPGSRRCASATPELLVHAENSAALLGAGAGALRHGALRRRGLRSRPLRRRSGRVGPRAGARAALLGRGAASPARSGESAGYGRRFVAAQPTELAVVPIGYGDGVRRVLSNNARGAGRRRRRAARRHHQHGQPDRRSRAGERRRGRRAGDPARRRGRASGSAPRSSPRVRARSTTRSPCALSPRVPREYHRDGEPR